jgi:dinuclear metal center YbgI/SA1388 family protein
MAQLKTITNYLDTLLGISEVPNDSSNNGLQVECSPTVHKIVFGVDASLELAERAAEVDADMIFVHHGLSWGSGFKNITGIDSKRFGTLLKNNISLYAAHLPLDAHPVVGHNAIIAKKLKLHNCRSFAKYANIKIGTMGELSKSIGIANFAEFVNIQLSLKTKIFGIRKGRIKKIGVISGGAGSDGIIAAANEGVECLVTGEIGHSSWHIINECGIAVITGGHYATETPGIIAVMDDLENMFDVECEFIDIPTGL